MEEAAEEEAIKLTAGPSTGTSAPPLPPFEEGIRTWGELIGILDPMDEPESVIDPLVVENGVDRIRRMDAEERNQLAIQLVRFLAVLYAEILRMLQLAEQEEVASLIQMPGLRNVRLLSSEQQAAGHVEEECTGDEVEDDGVNFMQSAADKFGIMLQKLLGLLERVGQPGASVRASFLRSMLADIQRPGVHITAAVIDKMDRLQALLLSFDEGSKQEATDEDREWCFGQWEVLKATLLDRHREAPAVNVVTGGTQQAASSTDIVCLEDSQEPDTDIGGQVAVMADGSTRPLTEAEMEEIAFHEEMEAEAAARETQADEQRWLEYRAQCLREEENRDMREAMDEAEDTHSRKKARVMVQVEGEGGRIVRSEVFNLVVNEGEALTYKIMVLPRNDPEVRALRRRQAVREGEAGMENESSSGSAASAETVRADERGRALPPMEAPTNEAMEEFMKTTEGETYYQKWLKGEVTCAMVPERSGAGLLAKFFSRKVDEEAEEDMVGAALLAEAAAKNGKDLDEGGSGAKEVDESSREPKEVDKNGSAPAEEAQCPVPASETMDEGNDSGDVAGNAAAASAAELESATRATERAVIAQSTLRHWILPH